MYSRENGIFVNVNMHRAYFSTTAGKNCCSFRVTDMQDILEFILDNILLSAINRHILGKFCAYFQENLMIVESL